ncbi:MAG: putative histidine kinase, hybrid [Noviherbaspirillum sp.]|nr:putative histidine kinase, hybrid [Noviherbaspirillum sp.]
MRIRTRLLILILAIVVPAFIAAAFGISYVYTEAQQTYRQNMRETTRALALVVDKEISERKAILGTLAASPALDGGDLETFYKQAKRIAPGPDTTIILSEPSGKLLLNTRLPFHAASPPVVAAIQELRRQKHPEDTVVSNVYFAPLGKQHSFSVEMPVIRNGRILYYIEIGSFARHLQAVFKDQQLPAAWTGTIVDRDAVVVARSKEPDEFVGKPVKEHFVQQIQTMTEGFREDGNSLSGEPVVAFFSRAPASDWSFIVSVPASEVQGAAVRTAGLTGGVSLLLLCVAISAALIVGRQTARQIEALRRGAEQLGRGETVTAKTSGIVEMDAVNAAMMRASAEIQGSKTELERQIAEAVAEAEQSQRALFQAQKLDALGRLTAGISHDFNNILQTLTIALDMLHLSASEPKIRSMVESCQRAVQRASELSGRLSAFGRIQDARFETVNLRRQIEAIFPLLKDAARPDIDFSIDIAEEIWPVTLDPLQFELALLNLTINARDAMPQGGLLKLTVRNETLLEPVNELSKGEYVCVSVADTGVGMSPDVLAKAFDPFFTTKGVGKGSGMGLPQAYGFARQAGGTLVVQSRLNEGTKATLYLPKGAREATEPMVEQKAIFAGASGGSILFVEDDAHVRDVMCRALENSGFDVVAASDAEKAIALLDQGSHFDLVFSDIVMPGQISGIDLAEVVNLRFPAVPVILATGYSEHRVSLSGVRVMAKPYAIADVVNAINEQLQLRKLAETREDRTHSVDPSPQVP